MALYSIRCVSVQNLKCLLFKLYLTDLTLFRSRNSASEMKNPTLVKKLLRAELEELGNMSCHEGMVASLFALMILLWFFRDNEFFPGWIHLFQRYNLTDNLKDNKIKT